MSKAEDASEIVRPLGRWIMIVFAPSLALSSCEPTVHDKAPELVGTWEPDLDLTRKYPGNSSLDEEKLRLGSWLFGVQMREKMTMTFFSDGHFSMGGPGNRGDFTFRVVTRDGDRLTLESQIVIDPGLIKYAEEGAFAPFESEWVLLGQDRIARTTGEDGGFWIVYRRVDPEWRRIREEALKAPPIRWSSTEVDPLKRESEFNDWYFRTPFLVPEVRTTVTCHRSVENRPVIIESKPAIDFLSCTLHHILFQAFCLAGVGFPG